MASSEPKNTKLTMMSIVQTVLVSMCVVIGVYVLGGVPVERVMERLTSASFHRPDWHRLAEASPAARIHLAFAVLALVTGALQFIILKGTPVHRAIGRGWLMLMVIAAASSFFVRNIRPGHFSLIHSLSVVTLLAVPWIIHTAKTGRICEHRKTATGLYVGGLLVAGALAILPGRLLWSVFFD